MDTINLDLPLVGDAELMPACAARAAAHRAEIDALQGHISRLQAQVTVLRLELAWYADRDNWRVPGKPGGNSYGSHADADRGHRARKALER